MQNHPIQTKDELKELIGRIYVIRSFLSSNRRYSALNSLRPHPILPLLKDVDLSNWVEFYNPEHGDVLIITPSDEPIDMKSDTFIKIYSKYRKALPKDICLN